MMILMVNLFITILPKLSKDEKKSADKELLSIVILGCKVNQGQC